MITRILVVISILIAVTGLSALAQQPSPSNQNSDCQVPIYKGRNADRKAKILAKPDPEYTARERREYEGAVISLRAVLCGSGAVTDVVVKSGLTPALDDKAVAAARKIKFVPGEHEGQPISTLITVLYRVK